MSLSRFCRWATLLTACVLCGDCLILAQSPSFSAPSVYVAGQKPHDVVLADFDGDGLNDVAVINLVSNDLRIFTNIGGVALSLTQTLPCPTAPYDQDTADFNGDGLVDLAVVSAASGTLYIFLNNGAGVLNQASATAVGANPIRVETADLNSDGSYDALITYELLDKVGIFSIAETGVVSGTTNMSTGPATYEVLCVDFDLDADLDMAITVAGEDKLKIFRNDGFGGFSFGFDVHVGSFPWSIASGDLNADAYPDIVVGNYYPSDFRVVFNDSGVGFSATDGPHPVGYETTHLNVSDLDLDSDLDVIVSHGGRYSGGGVIIYSNDGSGALSLNQSIAYDRNHCVVGDFDDYGGDDIVINGFFTGTVAIMLNESPCHSTVTGTVSAAGIGLHGVVLDLFNEESSLVGSALTDESGTFQFNDLDCGHYSITVVTPLGYTANVEMVDFEVSAKGATVDFELLRQDIDFAARSRGYWVHQVNGLLYGKGHPQETYDSMCEYMELIRTRLNEHGMNPVNVFDVPFMADCNQRLEALRLTISPKAHALMNEKARAHLSALLLNMVSGKIAQWHLISEDSLSVSQAITFCNGLIVDGIPDNDEIAKDIAEMINDGAVVPAGWIDPRTPDIAYKRGVRSNLPSEHTLAQNFPNPFNPATDISFNLNQASFVRLQVFNSLGRLVATVFEGYLQAGAHSYAWDGSTVASGVYLYRLGVGEFKETKKMLLLK